MDQLADLKTFPGQSFMIRYDSEETMSTNIDQCIERLLSDY